MDSMESRPSYLCPAAPDVLEGAAAAAAAAPAVAAAAEPESTDSMEHCRYDSAEAWRRGDKSRALEQMTH